jgi:hypothetical protein
MTPGVKRNDNDLTSLSDHEIGLGVICSIKSESPSNQEIGSRGFRYSASF